MKIFQLPLKYDVRIPDIFSNYMFIDPNKYYNVHLEARKELATNSNPAFLTCFSVAKSVSYRFNL